MKAVLTLENVSKRFGGVVAADQVSFQMEPGTIHGLIGPNGAGKSTLMNLISGIYTVDEGKIYFEDADITTMAPHNRAKLGIGRTFQVPRFMQRSNIRDNLLMGSDVGVDFGYFKSFLGKKNMGFEKELEGLMDMVDFDITYDQEISTFSFGQQKILEIVRSLLAHPKVLLVDEPAAGLNRKEVENVTALLQFAAKEKGISVLLIEHAMDLVMSFCEDIVVINFGKVIAKGVPDAITSNPDVIKAYLGGEL